MLLPRLRLSYATITHMNNLVLSLCTLFTVLSAVSAAPQTPINPFRAIAELVPKAAEEPVCCLRPLQPLVPEPEDELLLSFEEWKSKHASQSGTISRTSVSAGDKAPIASGAPEAAIASMVLVEHDVSAGSYSDEATSRLGPHFSVPLTDRFNFAATDCSARVHAAHKSAQGKSGILSAKRDKYMLSPCAAPGQYVVVELCDDVRIDTVQLATFEFFSGVFKDLRVSVAKTYTTDPAGWTLVDTYRAKNRRGVQSFHPPTTVRDFYRYIRIDFLSHYGSEFYCPVSLLRVYGLTHLDEWKWEVWETESRARLEQAHIGSAYLVTETIVSAEEEKSSPIIPNNIDQAVSSEQVASATIIQHELTAPAPTPETTITTEIESHQLSTRSPAASAMEATIDSSPAVTHAVQANMRTSLDPKSTSHSASDTTSIPSSTHSNLIASSSAANSATNTTKTISTSVLVPVVVVSPPPPTPPGNAPPVSVPPSSPGGGGENIYRTIMNRLIALENNVTLHASFVDSNAQGTREALRRLAEDVGRLDAASRVASATLKRTVEDMRRDQARMRALNERLEVQLRALSQDVRHEKTLGLAQLVLVLTVLMFVALTRGGAPPVLSGTTSGSKNHTKTRSFGAELFYRLRTKSLTSPNNTPTTPPLVSRMPSMNKLVLPPPSSRAPSFRLSSPAPDPLGPAAEIVPQTPTVVENRPSVPPITRRMSDGEAVRVRSLSNSSPSHSSPTNRTPFPRKVDFEHNTSNPPARHSTLTYFGTPPRATKRWGRTAHLHELKRRRAARSSSTLRGGEGSDDGRENQSPSRASPAHRRSRLGSGVGKPSPIGDMTKGLREPLKVVTVSQRSPNMQGTEAWEDTDTDIDEVEDPDAL